MTLSMTPFSEHGLVDVVLSDQKRRAARITAVGQRHLLLTLFAGESTKAIPIGPDFTSAVLEGADAHGVSRVQGSIASVVSIADRQALTFKPSDPAVLRQRRSTPRVALDRGLLIAREGAPEILVAGHVLDLSVGGMRFRSAAPFSVAEHVRVFLEPQGTGRPLGAAGRIVRVEPGDHCALAFSDGRDARRLWAERLISTARVQS
jgi:hypothetical protein